MKPIWVAELIFITTSLIMSQPILKTKAGEVDAVCIQYDYMRRKLPFM